MNLMYWSSWIAYELIFILIGLVVYATIKAYFFLKYDKSLQQVISLKFIIKWYDFWIGFFWDSKKKYLYFFPLPCIGVIIKFNF